jgi:leucyl aminopeptidase
VTVDVRVAGEVPAGADAVVVPVFGDRLDAAPEGRFLAATGFTGRAGDARLLPGAGGGPATVVVGLGPSAGFDAAALRRAAAGAARAARRHATVAVTMPAGVDLPADAVRVVVEASLLGLYRFTAYKSAVEPDALEQLVVVWPAGSADGAVGRAGIVAEAVRLARDLGNEPGGSLTPTAFAHRASAVAAGAGLACEVWDLDRITAEGLGGLLGVNRGSDEPPRLVRLAHEPLDPTGTVALVGKGVTFDSGGLTLKPNSMMVDMKIDMAGAGAVLGAMAALPALGCRARVVGWLPLTDNMSGGDATRLGDVLRTRSGTTVEVRNADAEGRLILADAIALAAEEEPDAVVDVATLTDAVPMAVGRRYAGLAGNDDGWVAEVRAAAERAGELVWTMPLDGVDRRMLDSKVADLVNATGNRYGQSAVAALFLREFVPAGIAWAHLDVNGPAFCDEDDGDWTAGATGFGVRTLIELACRFGTGEASG